MNELDRNAMTASPVANEIEDQALDWLLRKDRGNWSSQDQAAFDAWLSESWSNTVTYWRLDAAWDRANRLGAMRHPAHSQGLLPQQRARKTILKVAAAVVLATAAGLVGFYHPSAPGDRYATDVGGHETLSLADGTRIELNTDTAIRVSLTNDRRSVQIEKGEAFFDVKHDARRPFTVVGGNARVVDLGTQFSVRRENDRLQVALLEGRAQVSVTNAGTASLLPGDVAMATATAVSVVKKPLANLGKDLAWRRGVLVFDNTTLAEAAAQFNRYNHTKLVLANASVAQVTVGGTFATNDVAAFARVATGVFGLHVESKDGEILVSR